MMKPTDAIFYAADENFSSSQGLYYDSSSSSSDTITNGEENGTMDQNVNAKTC